MLPIDILLRPMTEEECFDRLLEILASLGMPVHVWRKGGALRVIVRACARLYAAFSVLLAAFISSGFLETATGEWLTKLAWNVYGVKRRTATHAREKIRLTNLGANLYEDQIVGSIVVYNPITKKAYQNAEQFTLNPFSTIEVTFAAVEEGSASSSAANTITELETVLDGVEVINPKAFIGLDAENDDELRQACKDKLGAFSVRGPRTAYAWAIREATHEDGTPVNINRSSISRSSSKGQVFVWLASPTGAPLEADVEAVEESIEKRARPDAVTVFTDACTEVPVAKSLVVWARRRDGVAANDVKSTIETAIAREGANYPIGGIAKAPASQGYLYSDWLAGVAKQAWPDTFDVDGAGDDVALSAGEVAVLQVSVDVRLQDVA